MKNQHNNNIQDKTGTRNDKTRDSGLTEAFGGVSTSTTLFSSCASNMDDACSRREERKRGPDPNPMRQKIICFSIFETRLQQINQGQIETAFSLSRGSPLLAAGPGRRKFGRSQ